MTDEIRNGANLDPQPEPARQDPNRKYCDSCKFCQAWLGGNQLQLMCRKNPPQALGTYMPVQQGANVVPQLFSQTVWPIVTKQDWCDYHEDDPKTVRSGVKSTLIATDSSAKAS